ncbi:MAG TPA: L,D-transpeptidase family protein [Gaiellaceae bacterium]|nr:L,D-transpeptidase family protein [Gaiellaceae bacterium]
MKRVFAACLFAAGFAVAGVFAGTVIADTGTTTSSTSTTTTAPVTTATTAVATTTAPVDALPNGVTIGGVPVGGLARTDAFADVQRAFDKPLTVVAGTTHATLDPQSVASAYVPTAVARARVASPGASVKLVVHVNGVKLRAWVASLAARTSHAPINATLGFVKGRVKLTRDHPGVKLDSGDLLRRLVSALSTNTRTPLRATTHSAPASVTAASFGPVILINRSINKLFLYKNNGRSLLTERIFAVATGQSIYPTPKGTFHIVVKWVNPTWYPPTQDAWAKGLKPVPPGPDNPLGTRWMGLSVPGVGIHGTDEPASIGYSASHGCIRMQVPDAEWLFERVNVGTTVFIV